MAFETDDSRGYRGHNSYTLIYKYLYYLSGWGSKKEYQVNINSYLFGFYPKKKIFWVLEDNVFGSLQNVTVFLYAAKVRLRPFTPDLTKSGAPTLVGRTRSGFEPEPEPVRPNKIAGRWIDIDLVMFNRWINLLVHMSRISEAVTWPIWLNQSGRNYKMGFRPFFLSRSRNPTGVADDFLGWARCVLEGSALEPSIPIRRSGKFAFGTSVLSPGRVQIFFFLLFSMIVLWSVVVMSIWLGLIRTVMDRSFSAASSGPPASSLIIVIVAAKLSMTRHHGYDHLIVAWV